MTLVPASADAEAKTGRTCSTKSRTVDQDAAPIASALPELARRGADLANHIAGLDAMVKADSHPRPRNCPNPRSCMSSRLGPASHAGHRRLQFPDLPALAWFRPRPACSRRDDGLLHAQIGQPIDSSAPTARARPSGGTQPHDGLASDAHRNVCAMIASNRCRVAPGRIRPRRQTADCSSAISALVLNVICGSGCGRPPSPAADEAVTGRRRDS